MEQETPRPTVFMNYSREDLEAAKRLAQEISLSLGEKFPADAVPLGYLQNLIGYLQGKGVNEIVYKMCKIQLSDFDQITCYDNAYERIPRLPNGDLTRGYERVYSVQPIKSYYHFVRRTCRNLNYSCGRDQRRCDKKTIQCWKELSVNLKKNIEAILIEISSGLKRH